ncbi:MAG: hypothetical protein KAJ72_06485 [Candidatus Heimdallarchaeota archaeon]|nr:hypothetical protein [Candidatus Heimdallarchaeota archaeon]
MNQKTGRTKINTFTSLDRATAIQLFMITVVIIAYVMFLIFQRYLFSFEVLLSKLIMVNVLLAAGIVMEISYFVWTIYKKKKKLEAKSNSKEAEMEKTR